MISVEKPITSRNEDFLDRENFSDNIANAILNYNDTYKSSLTIGLYGKWGAGKTSVINMIVEQLDQNDDIIVFKFEPWIFSDTNQLISSFFKEFAKTVKHKDYAADALKVGEELETYATFFEPMSLIPEPTISILSIISSKVFGSVGKASKKWGTLKTKSLSDTKLSIEAHLEKLNKKILIIIDDIDRLNNTEIRQIFQMVKVLGNFPNTIYLMSMDKEVVVDALSEVQKGDGSEYLEKIINVPFDIPSITKREIERYLFKQLDQIIHDVDESDFNKNYWSGIYHSGYKDFFRNIRDVVRYVNVLRFNYSVLKNKVNVIDLIAITALQVFESKIFELIKHNKDFFVGSFPDSRYGGNEAKEKVKVFINDSFQYLQVLSNENYLKLLKELFYKINEAYSNVQYVSASSTCRKDAKLCSAEFFDTYFTMTLSDDEISKYEMKNYIQKMADESIFRNEILQLIIDDKIKIFLERIQDFTREDIPENHIQPFINVLMDIGDSIPNKYEGMFSFGNHMQIMRIFHQLLSRFNDKSKRFAILNEAMTKAQHSIYVMCHDISIQMQEHGEYEDDPKPDEQTTLTREMLSDLKEIFKSKVECWGLNDSLFEHENGLSILYVWLKLDELKVKNYVESAIVDEEQLLNFLTLFISYSYSQSSYTTQKYQKYDYEAVARFIDIEKIFSRLQALEQPKNIDDNRKYAIENFKQAYNGQILEEQGVPNV